MPKPGSSMRCSESSQRRWSGYLGCHGWIHQETLCNGISVTFDLSQPLALCNGFIEAMRMVLPGRDLVLQRRLDALLRESFVQQGLSRWFGSCTFTKGTTQRQVSSPKYVVVILGRGMGSGSIGTSHYLSGSPAYHGALLRRLHHQRSAGPAFVGRTARSQAAWSGDRQRPWMAADFLRRTTLFEDPL